MAQFKYIFNMYIPAKIQREIERRIGDYIVGPRKSKGESGANSEHFFFKASNDVEYVILIPRYENMIKGYKKVQTLLPFLHKQNLPCSIPSWLEIIDSPNGVCAVMERIIGHEGAQESFLHLPPENQKIFAAQIADFFVALHRCPIALLPKGLDYSDYFKTPKQEELYPFLLDIFSNEENETPGFCKKLYDRIGKIYHFGFDDCVFIHRDFHFGNAIVDDGHNLKAVFDWGNACVAPRLRDFCNLAGYNEKDSLLLKMVLESYNSKTGFSVKPQQVILFNRIQWAGCGYILKDRPALMTWAKNDGNALVRGDYDKDIEICFRTNIEHHFLVKTPSGNSRLSG